VTVKRNPEQDHEVHADAALKGRLRAVGAHATGAREDAARRVNDLRLEHDLVDAALEAGDLDRRRAGSLLAGGIAFRLFLWLLPAALLAATIAGALRLNGSQSPDHVARTLGLTASMASTIEQATKQSQRSPAVLLAIGIGAMLYASMSLVRALRVAHVLAWDEPFRHRPHALRDGGIFSLGIVATLVLETGISYLRHSDVGASLLLSVASFALIGGAWLGLSSLLPHADADWRALLPGALMFAAGQAVLHLATVYYFAPRLGRAPTLYGSLGAAATLLVWLFLVSRIVVASAFFNATLWRKRGGAPS
jgi:uncharacterized BrkB/YihY/UPF0761 family membrane protein